MNILIADDEPMACQHLSDMVSSLPGCHDVGHAADGVDAVYKASGLNIDVVFMDIRMPDMDGLEAARRISELDKPPAVVFTTAYEKYARKAFDVYARGFLLKPVRMDRLIEVLERLKSQSRRKVLEPMISDDMENRYICCRGHRGLDLIALNQIVYIRSQDKSTVIHHRNGYSLSDAPLKTFEKKFGNRMIRIHRNALINKAYMSGLEKSESGNYQVLMRNNNQKLEVSRRSLPQVRSYLESFMTPRKIIRCRERVLRRYKGAKRRT